MESTLAELRARPHTSISAVKTFLFCPRRYRLQYIDHVRPAFRSSALVLGSAWHETIAEWLTVDSAEPEALQAHLREGLVRRLRGADVLFDDEDEDEGKLVDSTQRMLDAFLASVPKPERVLGAEVPFSIELEHPLTAEVLPVRLIGSIDALVMEDGVETLWELKTAKRRWSADQLEFDQQATAYQIASRSMGYEPELKLLVTTKGAQPVIQAERLVRHRRDEDELIETMFSVHRAVEAGVDHPLRGWQCRTCAWAGACAS